MISGVYFLRLVLLILTHSDQALRKPRITSALFLFAVGGESKAQRPRSWKEADKGDLQSQTHKTISSLLPIEYGCFSITCPLCCCIHLDQDWGFPWREQLEVNWHKHPSTYFIQVKFRGIFKSLDFILHLFYF